jgi:hypothetical protein
LRYVARVVNRRRFLIGALSTTAAAACARSAVVSSAHRRSRTACRAATDHAAIVALAGLPDAQTACYRVRFEREAARGASAWARFRWAPPPGQTNLAPWGGLQSFGAIDVTRDALSVGIFGIDGRECYRVDLPFI